MTARQLIAWQRIGERRGRAVWASPVALAVAGGAVLAAWLMSRGDAVGASHAWLAGALGASAVAFLRVPFLVYWRGDAAFLAQLPLDGRTLGDVALWRCARAAAAIAAALVLGAVPLMWLGDAELFARHVAFAGALAAAAGALMPAVAIYTASFVATDLERSGPRSAAAAAAAHQLPAAPPTALLGAGPGFIATFVIADVVAAAPWLVGRTPTLSPAIALGGLAAIAVLSVVGIRAVAAASMAKILRDVSALDRQRLATLEIRPPTALESAVARALGDGALPYRKDARLMRRRYPMAFALGGIAFLVLVIVGIARPADATPYLAPIVGGAIVYAAVLAGRLARPPIELPRLSASLPIEPAAIARARRAWVAVWLGVYALVPAVFAALRVWG
jgi:hypothetical protein|nr:hypothetical protein [Kofleriaceae bacterium]